MSRKGLHRIYSLSILGVAFYYAFMIQITPAITSAVVKETIGYITIGLMAIALIAICKLISSKFSSKSDKN